MAELTAPSAATRRPDALGRGRAASLYQLGQSLGTVPARDARAQIRALTDDDRRALRRMRVRVGRHVVFVPPLLAPAAVRARVALTNANLGPGARLAAPPPEAVSVPVEPDFPVEAYAAIGYPVFGARAIRADLADGIGTRLLSGAPFAEVAGRLGCGVFDMAAVRATFAHGAGAAAGAQGGGVDEAADRPARRADAGQAHGRGSGG